MTAAPDPAAFRRSLHDAIAGRNAPIAPGGDPEGFLLRDLIERECRFPTGGGHQGTRFCAVPVEPGVWRIGRCGSYCRHHRDYLARQPRSGLDEREAR